MNNFCYMCGKQITVTTVINRATSNFICDECYSHSKKAKVKYKILYKNGFEDKIIQEADAEKIKLVNSLIHNGFQNSETGVLTFGDGLNEGYIIRIDDISRIQIINC